MFPYFNKKSAILILPTQERGSHQEAAGEGQRGVVGVLQAVDGRAQQVFQVVITAMFGSRRIVADKRDLVLLRNAQQVEWTTAQPCPPIRLGRGGQSLRELSTLRFIPANPRQQSGSGYCARHPAGGSDSLFPAGRRGAGWRWPWRPWRRPGTGRR